MDSVISKYCFQLPSGLLPYNVKIRNPNIIFPGPLAKMVAHVNMAHLLTQHQNYNQNIEQPSLRTVRNQVEWMSDNYRIKETTSIQAGTKGGDAEWTGPTSMCGG